MAQIPYQPYSSVEPAGGSEQLSVSTPPAAFGANVGAALQGLGATTEQVGGELFTRAMALQELKNQNDARDAQVEYVQKASLLQADFDSKVGINAGPEQLQAHLKAQADLRQQYRNTLNTQYAQKYFDSDTIPFMQRNIFSSARHAGDEFRKSTVDSAKSNLDLTARNWVDPKSPSEFGAKIRDSQRDIQTISDTEGWTPAQQADAAAKQISGIKLGQIKEISLTDPSAAMDMLSQPEVKKQLGQVNYEIAFKTAQAQLHQTGPRVISQIVNGDLYEAPDPTRPEKGLQARMQEGAEIARKNHPNDPEFPDFVRNRIETDYNKQMGAVRDFQFQNNNTVAGAIVGATETGARPTNVEELKAVSPKVAAAWDHLPATVQRGYLRQLAENNKGDRSWTVDGLRRYQQLKGMASDDPSGFLDLPIVGENIPMSARKELINLQQKVKQNADSFPEVNKSMQLLGPMLQSAGILDDKDSRFQFRGMLSDALQDFHNENKRAPTPDEIKLMGTQATQQIATGNLFFNRNAPLFQVPIPSALLEAVKEHYKDSGQPIPSDEDLRREYARQQYQKLYGGGSKIKPTTGKGNPSASPQDPLSQ